MQLVVKISVYEGVTLNDDRWKQRFYYYLCLINLQCGFNDDLYIHGMIHHMHLKITSIDFTSVTNA